MSGVPLPSTDVRDTERLSAELAAMRRMIEVAGNAFSLSIAVCNSPALRDYLLEQLRTTFPAAAMIVVPPDTVDVYGFVAAQSLRAPPAVLSIVNLERSIHSSDGTPLQPMAASRHTLRSLNAARELWESRFACPIVIWLPEYAARFVSMEARDLWRYVSHHFEFVAAQASAAAALSDRFAGDLSGAANLTVDEKRFRIAELEQRLAEIGPNPPKSLLSHVSVWLAELGYLYLHLGEPKRAEVVYQKAMDIYKTHDRQAGMAATYSNLGQIYQSRGETKKAEAMLHQALAISERFGRQEDMVQDYGNLGLIYHTRGELDRAEEMYKKALEINEQLGRQEGLALNYGNLGALYLSRGELDQAEGMLQKAVALNEKLGRQEGLARDFGNLGLVCRARGDLDRAEEMHNKALLIDEKLGHQEGVARHIANLGSICEQRGDMERARGLWGKARDLYARIGMPQAVKEVQEWLDAAG